MITLTLTKDEADLLKSILTDAASKAEFTSTDNPDNDLEESVQALLDKLEESS